MIMKQTVVWAIMYKSYSTFRDSVCSQSTICLVKNTSFLTSGDVPSQAVFALSQVMDHIRPASSTDKFQKTAIYRLDNYFPIVY